MLYFFCLKPVSFYNCLKLEWRARILRPARSHCCLTAMPCRVLILVSDWGEISNWQVIRIQNVSFWDIFICVKKQYDTSSAWQVDWCFKRNTYKRSSTSSHLVSQFTKNRPFKTVFELFSAQPELVATFQYVSCFDYTEIYKTSARRLLRCWYGYMKPPNHPNPLLRKGIKRA